MTGAWYGSEAVLVRDARPGASPPLFRSSDGPLPSLGPAPVPGELWLGLATLRASASGQPSAAALAALRARTTGPLLVVDLRQEAHGFVDETPVSAYAPRNWGNLGRGRTGALAAEARLLEDLRERVARDGALTFPGHPKDHRIARDFPGELGRVTPQPERVAARVVRAEEEVVRSTGAGYQRLLVTDHQGPPLEELERFEAVLGALAAGTWVHFHCRGGKGRAATFLLLYDILRNAHQVALSALLLRQRLLSRYAVDELAAPGDWKRPYQEERLLQVRAFYARRRAAAR